MKNILRSMLVISAVAAVVIGGTVAYFTDKEESLNNVFTTGTIDIAVDDENPWNRTAPYTFEDMKPSQVEYSNFEIENVGTNPANVWKTIGNFRMTDEITSEPECDYSNGTWDSTNLFCTYNSKDDIDTVIDYDLSVQLFDESEVMQWEQVLYKMDKTIDELENQAIFLGMIPEGWYMKVTESYHMQGDTENWAQGDKLTFDITLDAEQLKGVAILEDKDSSDWRVKDESAPKVTVEYGVKESALNISDISGMTVVAGNHSLITYPEAYSDPSGSGYPGSGIVLATVVADGSGNITSFTQVATDPGTFTNMKVWLVPDSDLAGASLSAWNPSNYMFDTGLVDYYKSN